MNTLTACTGSIFVSVLSWCWTIHVGNHSTVFLALHAFIILEFVVFRHYLTAMVTVIFSGCNLGFNILPKEAQECGPTLILGCAQSIYNYKDQVFQIAADTLSFPSINRTTLTPFMGLFPAPLTHLKQIHYPLSACLSLIVLHLSSMLCLPFCLPVCHVGGCPRHALWVLAWFQQGGKACGWYPKWSPIETEKLHDAECIKQKTAFCSKKHRK